MKNLQDRADDYYDYYNFYDFIKGLPIEDLQKLIEMADAYKCEPLEIDFAQ